MWTYRNLKPRYRGRYKRYNKNKNNPKRRQVPKGITKRKAATYPVSNVSAQKAAITRQPIFGSASKLIRDQLYSETNLDYTLQTLVQDTQGTYFVANGAYDPYFPTGGHQIMGFDQMMQLYNHYAVIRCKITATFFVEAGGDNSACQCGIALFPEATSPLPVSAVIVENGYTKFITLNNNYRSTGSVSMEVDIKTYYGKDKYSDILDDQQLCGTAAANPTEGCYFLVYATNSITEKAQVVHANVILSYDVIYFEPRKLPLS